MTELFKFLAEIEVFTNLTYLTHSTKTVLLAVLFFYFKTRSREGKKEKLLKPNCLNELFFILLRQNPFYNKTP